MNWISFLVELDKYLDQSFELNKFLGAMISAGSKLLKFLGGIG